MAKYDTIAKYLIQIFPRAIVRLVLGRDDVEIDDILETEIPRVETRLTDSLIRVRIDGQAVLVHTEFQTTDSANMPIRMATYIIRLIERYGLPVYSHVIYLRPNAGRRDEGFYHQAHPDYSVLARYKVIRLSELDGRAILEGGQDGLLPFTPLMKRPAGMDSEAWLRECIRISGAVSLGSADKADFLGGLAVLSGLAYDPTTITSILFQEGFMDAIMRESSFAQYLGEQFKEQFLEQGIEQGIERGIEQGIEQGIERGIQESIREALAIRFDAGVAERFADRIATIDDLQRLKQLLRSAVQGDDIEAFQRVLDAEA